MTDYKLSWITENLALGHAPMSYAELDSLKAQGIGAILNLCAEFPDLHEIEESYGFEVYYLPVPDDGVPAESELEEALDWLDEAVYLGKRVLVHCRFGLGRTSTVVAAYLLRKGFGLKLAQKKVDEARRMQSSFSQWRLLKKYSKKSGVLTIREPSLEGRRAVDLSQFFLEYEGLLRHLESLFEEASKRRPQLRSCGSQTDACCYENVQLSFVEAAYLNHHMNKELPGQQRKDAIERAVRVSQQIRQIQQAISAKGPVPDASQAFEAAYEEARISCPLNVEATCILYEFRPVACRIFGTGKPTWAVPPTGPALKARKIPRGRQAEAVHSAPCSRRSPPTCSTP